MLSASPRDSKALCPLTYTLGQTAMGPPQSQAPRNLQGSGEGVFHTLHWSGVFDNLLPGSSDTDSVSPEAHVFLMSSDKCGAPYLSVRMTKPLIHRSVPAVGAGQVVAVYTDQSLSASAFELKINK